ncbi:hypothetical protein BJ170DRAFT_189571 [Xylariales sp. AK1849]|nr:hypothetical protein BJ170DRAFT_189571 [Xylariales sp. AK1849]
MASENTKFTLARLLGSGEYSDLTLVCQAQEFMVHKPIVCPQSPVIAAALRGDFQEAKTSRVEVNFDIATLKCMLGFLYTGNYTVLPEPDTSPKEPTAEEMAIDTAEVGFSPNGSDRTDDSTQTQLTVLSSKTRESVLCHVRVNMIGDYYDVPNLVQLANANINQHFRDEWSVQIFSLATEQLSASGDLGWQKTFAPVAAEHVSELIASERFSRLEVVTGIAFEILQSCAQRLQTAKDSLQTTKFSLLITNSRMKEIENDRDLQKRALDEFVALRFKLSSKFRCPGTYCGSDFTGKITKVSTGWVLCCVHCDRHL